jgi:hypothetical protein
MDVAGVLGSRQRGLYVGSHCSCGWGGCGWLRAWICMALLERDHPEASVHAFVVADNSAATIHDGASNLREGDSTGGVAHCNNEQEGVQCKARDDVSISGGSWQLWEIKSAGVRQLHSLSIW